MARCKAYTKKTNANNRPTRCKKNATEDGLCSIHYKQKHEKLQKQSPSALVPKKEEKLAKSHAARADFRKKSKKAEFCTPTQCFSSEIFVPPKESNHDAVLDKTKTFGNIFKNFNIYRVLSSKEKDSASETCIAFAKHNTTKQTVVFKTFIEYQWLPTKNFAKTLQAVQKGVREEHAAKKLLVLMKDYEQEVKQDLSKMQYETKTYEYIQQNMPLHNFVNYIGNQETNLETCTDTKGNFATCLLQEYCKETGKSECQMLKKYFENLEQMAKDTMDVFYKERLTGTYQRNLLEKVMSQKNVIAPLKIHTIVTELRPATTNVSGYFLKEWNGDVLVAKAILFQVFFAMLIMRAYKMQHNDLHTENILLDTKPLESELKFTVDKIKRQVLLGAGGSRSPKIMMFDWDRSYVKALGRNKALDEGYCSFYGECNALNERFDTYRFIQFCRSELFGKEQQKKMNSLQKQSAIEIEAFFDSINRHKHQNETEAYRLCMAPPKVQCQPYPEGQPSDIDSLEKILQHNFFKDLQTTSTDTDEKVPVKEEKETWGGFATRVLRFF